MSRLVLAAALAMIASAATAQNLTLPTDTQNPGGITMTFTPNGTVFNLPLQYGHPESGYISVPPRPGYGQMPYRDTPQSANE